MFADPALVALKTPGHIRFPGNEVFVEGVEQAGGRMVRQSAGHLVFYRPDGRRFLATDPAGHPLHECEWGQDVQGKLILLRARIRLDWGAWVGIKPAGLVNETRLNLATRPGWQRLTPDDLRGMAAKALQVPVEEVRWFYRDEDLSIDRVGIATIRHRKDAFYLLNEGDFSKRRFMSCMGAMNWANIDFLPVVELFKSLLPGTGSAAFELIRGLYDDQHQRSAPTPLRYRGIPTYPSEEAFRLFSSYFTPHVEGHRDVHTVFMDQAHSHEVLWLPSPSPPLRYFNAAHGCCLTFKGDLLQKATLADDSTGLPYVSPGASKVNPCDRLAFVAGGCVILQDRHRESQLRIALPEGHREQSPAETTVSPVDWRSLFVPTLPPIDPPDAYGAVLFYPEDDAEIGETAAQPFVADYIQDLAQQDREIGKMLAEARHVLIVNGDAVIATCVPFDRPRNYTAWVSVPALAQKQAQRLWTICAGLKRWDWLAGIKLWVGGENSADRPSSGPHDLAYFWIPYAIGRDPGVLAAFIGELGGALRTGGCAFVTGPDGLDASWRSWGFRLAWQEPVETLPTFRMHRNVLPRAKLKPGLTLYQVIKA